MSWAARRRFIILLIIGAVILAFLSTVLIATLYKAPSCTDGIQNQDETGVDCGGACAYLCSADLQPPTVLFTKSFDTGLGRTNVVASVENKNAAAAAKDVPYRVQLYGANQELVQEFSGTFDLPPGATVPVFIPGIATGAQRVARSFLSIASSAPMWFGLERDLRIMPRVSNTKQSGTLEAPRIEAILANPGTTALADVPVVVFVRDSAREIIAASETVISVIPAGGQATATFTWGSAFPGVPVSIEVIPVIPLP